MIRPNHEIAGPPGPARWLLLVHHLPPKPAYLRVKIWRRLQGLGAISVKNSVYVLPAGDQALEDFQWLLREIEQSVPAHHLEGGAAPGLGQCHRAVLLVVDEALLGEFADRLGGRARRHPDPVGQHFGADFLDRPFLGIPDDLQVVLTDRGDTAWIIVSPHKQKV